MDPEKRKLLLLAGVGVVVLYLFSRAKNASPTQKAAAADPLAGVAQQLQAQQARQQADLEYAKAQVQANIDNTNLQFAEFQKLAGSKAYACPDGGRPRWIPGRGPGCIGPKSSSGGFFGQLLGVATGILGRYLPGRGGGYTPPLFPGGGGGNGGGNGGGGSNPNPPTYPPQDQTLTRSFF